MNGAAHQDGRIRSGDKILAINGQDVSASKQDIVALQLQVCIYYMSLHQASSLYGNICMVDLDIV